MKIIVITYGYPCLATPTAVPFVKELVDCWKKENIQVIIINPLTYHKYKKIKNNSNENEYYPLFFDYCFFKFIPRLRNYLSDRSFYKAVNRCIKDKIDENTILYSHFLNAGICAGRISKNYNIKSYCAFGESSLWSIKNRNINRVLKLLKNISGFISVSSKNKNVLVDNNIATEENILLAPNGVDLSKFKKYDKSMCRKELKLPEKDTIGIFVGHFIERKGPRRVEEATKNIENLKMIYIGEGEQKPEGDNICFCGKIQHDKINKYLCSADFFVLPTQAEGCCNAIIEAMACGLPIISSNLEFNDDILDDSMSIRINPNSIDEINYAIKILFNDSKRSMMSKKAYDKSQKYDVKKRANNILDFISNQERK